MGTGPSWRDWAMLAIGVFFCAMAVIIGISDGDWRMPLFTLAFFGFATVMFAGTIRRKLRDRQYRGEAVTIPGGVEIGMDMRKVWLMGGGILFLGVVTVFVVPAAPIHITIIGIFLIGVGLVLVGGHLLRLLPRRTLRFEPDGICFGFGKYSAFVEWGNVAAVTPGEISDNPAVLLELLDAGRVRVEPPSASAQFMRDVAKCRVFPGGDLSIMTTFFGVDAVPLAAAIVRYARDEEARKELAPQNRLRPGRDA